MSYINPNKVDIFDQYKFSAKTWYRYHRELKIAPPIEMLDQIDNIGRRYKKVIKPRYYLKSVQEVFGALQTQPKLDKDGNEIGNLKNFANLQTILKYVPNSTFFRKKDQVEEYHGLYNLDDCAKVFRRNFDLEKIV